MKLKAINTIYKSITPHGILASSNVIDNYDRIWSRDGVMTSLIGLLISDKQIIEAGAVTIFNLAKSQSEFGQMPSNISISEKSTSVSFGTHVGRVDATVWWVIGASIYLKNKPDLFNQTQTVFLRKSIYQALQILHVWEFNNKGLIFTPIGGNWADEYVSQGYTLYDNCLRYWAVKSAADYLNDEKLVIHSKIISQLIKTNYNSNSLPQNAYHKTAYENLVSKKLPFMPSSFSANGYDTRWDMAGNAMALLLGLNQDVDKLKRYLVELSQHFKHWMLPVFYPIITPDSNDWNLLQNNFNYQFKNEPFCFHNGGSWPVFLGWLALGLAQNNDLEITNKIFRQYQELLMLHQNISFNEYYNTKTLEPKGTNSLCFSSIGYLLLESVANNSINTKLLLL